MSNQLYTKWGRTLDTDHVLQEYPRPSLVRESYLNLNGIWEYSIDKNDRVPDKYEGNILVPFSPEAPLSGVRRQVHPDEILHYRRIFELKEEFLQGKVLLHFGAVDQICSVFVNGSYAFRHCGGYLPFTVDVTELVQAGENVLQVEVRDYSDTSYHARGKQKLNRGGMWYTAQSGIWQTVWMECVPELYIREIKITPCYDEKILKLKVFTQEKGTVPCTAEISFKGNPVKTVNFAANRSIAVPMGNFMSWTPDEPNLYDMKITMGADCVKTYFAMRKYSVERDSRGILRFMLNNEPFLQNGLLDQGYYPDGLYTAPSDEALQYDILKMKELGFNVLRKHLKIEPERWYYHCDRLGMIVWQDMVNGGGVYNMKFICNLPNTFMWTDRVIKDNKYKLFARDDEDGRQEYYRELRAMIHHLYNFPCIAAWIPFNEGWGQFDAAKATKMVRNLDPTRLIDEASGWFDQHGGDMYSIHNYWRVLKVKPRRKRVVALTECGGYSYHIEGHSFYDKVYGYRTYQSQKDLMDGIAGLWENELMPNIQNGLSAIIYTQVSDVEEEVNGMVTYDREEVKVDEQQMQMLNKRLYEVFKENI